MKISGVMGERVEGRSSSYCGGFGGGGGKLWAAGGRFICSPGVKLGIMPTGGGGSGLGGPLAIGGGGTCGGGGGGGRPCGGGGRGLGGAPGAAAPLAGGGLIPSAGFTLKYSCSCQIRPKCQKKLGNQGEGR